MVDGIEVRLFFGAAGAEGSHARRFPAVPAVGQTIVFGRTGEAIAVYRVAETGFFAWGRSDEEGGASLWARLEPVPGAHVPRLVFTTARAELRVTATPPPIESELDRLLGAARAWEGAPLALATVISTWGSAPRPRGSHMLVHADGRFEGSVSGGCVEGEVLAAAGDAIADGNPRRLVFDVSEETAWAASLPCGGAIEVLVQPVREDGFAPVLFGRIAEGRAAGRTVTIATDLDTGESREGAEEGWFANTYLPPRRLLIVGAVQIALPLARFAQGLDITPAILDPRDRFRTAERFPRLELDDRWPDEAIAARRPDPATAVVTLSHDPKIDDPALAAALRSPAGYIAALGSRRSHARRLERLGALGFDAAALARIEGPAGIAIGALGPAEIALSIAAGMVRAFRAAGEPAD